MILGGLSLTEPRTMTWTGIALVVLAAWILLAATHGDAGIALETIAALCRVVGGSIGLAFYPAVLAMWLLMSVAMMLPTALPTIDLYTQLTRRIESGRAVRIVLFVSGYLVAWFAFSALAAAAQVALRALPVDTVPPLAAAGALVVFAGVYQRSALKARCLAECRNPMLFFMSRWREDLPGTLWLGILHGAICVGCCWALMLLMFATGTMNLAWMALLGLLMLAEKILPGAETWGRVAGLLMIAAGAAMVFTGMN